MEDQLHDHDEARIARAEEGLRQDHTDRDERRADAHYFRGPNPDLDRRLCLHHHYSGWYCAGGCVPEYRRRVPSL